jgi:5'-nucleotidase
VQWTGDEGSDFHAVEKGYISVTPLHLDLTNYGLLADVERWDLDR